MNLRMSTAPHVRCGETTTSLMRNVVIAMVPCAIAGVYRFGWNALIILALATVSAMLAEYLWQVIAKQPVRVGDMSAFVTGMLVGLNLPPTAPMWLPVVGSALAIILVKQLFGGIGDNFMNPALAARAMLLMSWPVHMTNFVAPTNFSGVDAVSAATPLASGTTGLWDLFAGNIPGVIGETSKAMILLGLVYLLLTRTISWRIPVIMVATTFVSTWAFGMGPVAQILSGGLLFGAVFMATDYTTSPMTAKGQCVYAVGCGLIVAIIRRFGAYPEGVTYAILLMNIATPLIDRSVKHRVYGHAKEAKKNG